MSRRHTQRSRSKEIVDNRNYDRTHIFSAIRPCIRGAGELSGLCVVPRSKTRPIGPGWRPVCWSCPGVALREKGSFRVLSNSNAGRPPPYLRQTSAQPTPLRINCRILTQQLQPEASNRWTEYAPHILSSLPPDGIGEAWLALQPSELGKRVGQVSFELDPLDASLWRLQQLPILELRLDEAADTVQSFHAQHDIAARKAVFERV